jgi:uncharacterized protein YegP (UPF0339 family)
MSSIKNRLQEYYQKKGLPLPRYEDHSQGEQEWLATLYLNNGEFIFQSGIHRSKKDAHTEVAISALKHLQEKGEIQRVSINNKPKISTSKSHSNSRSTCCKPSISTSRVSNTDTNGEVETLGKKDLKLKLKTVLYVDIENQHKAVDMLLSEYNFVNLRIFAVKSRSTNTVRVESKSDIFDLITIDAHSRDASDIYITMLASLHASNSSFEEYLILTSDNFGFTLSDILKWDRGLWKVRSSCFNSLNELKIHLEKNKE